MQAIDWIQVEALGSGPDALDVRLTMASIEDSPFAEFRSTELAGRVAAVCGVRSLAGLAASSEERVSIPPGEYDHSKIIGVHLVSLVPGFLFDAPGSRCPAHLGFSISNLGSVIRV